MIGDLTFLWMSEVRSGKVRDVRQRLLWLARTQDVHVAHTSTGRWLRELSVLGHAEVDWDGNRWATCPPVIARLPIADGTAVLAGRRPAGLVERLLNCDVAVHSPAPDPPIGDLPIPTAVILQFDSTDAVQAAAREIGARYASCASVKLARRLPELALGPSAAPPAVSNETLERLDASCDRIAFQTAIGDTDGLYRLNRQGRRIHLYRLGAAWHRCDLSAGVFIDLARRGQSVIRWSAEDGRGRHEVGTMYIDRRAPLPLLHARALTLCCGLPARVGRATGTAIYANVPSTVAQAVARSLRQQLQPA